MIELESQKVHNINLVTPSIWIDQIREAIILAKNKGLTIPIVYNTNAYDNIEKLKILNGLIDIYLPDFKYSDNSMAEKYSQIKNYKEIALSCILEMLNQQPHNIVEDNIMKKGIIIRHLILPNNLENTKECIKIINSISSNIILSLMTQYNPMYKASDYSEINRSLNDLEYNEIMDYLKEFDFEEIFYQPLEANAKDVFNPDFTKENPFKY